jgi:hypothetical protein
MLPSSSGAFEDGLTECVRTAAQGVPDEVRQSREQLALRQPRTAQIAS